MLAQADLRVLACPLTPQTFRFLNTEHHRRLRADAIVINVAPGDLVHDDALIAALSSGRIRAAGLDAFAGYPEAGAAEGVPFAAGEIHGATERRATVNASRPNWLGERAAAVTAPLTSSLP